MMKADDIVVVDFDGNIIEGTLRPSVDLPSHLALYKAHQEIGAIVHTHSTFATAWAQKVEQYQCMVRHTLIILAMIFRALLI